MRFSTAVTAVILAFSASTFAAPTAEGKPFKFSLKVKEGTFYLTQSGGATTDKAQATDCTLTGDKIACGANKGGMGSMMHTKLAPSPGATNNRGWAISADNKITYTPGGTKYHLTKLKSKNELWAENCDAHPDGTSYSIGEAIALYEA